MKISNDTLIIGDIPVDNIMSEYGSPLYVYEESVLRTQLRELLLEYPKDLVEIHYSMKANSNPSLLRIIYEEGASIDAVSEFEVRLAIESGFDPKQIIFTGNNNCMREIEYCVGKKVSVNLGSLHLLEEYGQRYPNTIVSIRVNPGFGAGHHSHCITGGPDSKFGIYYNQVEIALAIAKKFKLKINGIHSHIGTGIFSAEPMLEAMEMILNVAKKFPELEFVDFGGGFGIPYSPEQSPLDLKNLSKKMMERFKKFVKNYGNNLQMKIEPGRFLIGPSGILLATVTNITDTPKYRFVGVDTGFNHLIRPTLYGSYHKIINASSNLSIQKDVVVVGNICESGDILSRSDGKIKRRLHSPKIGERIAFLDVGAYGYSMSSQYNLRPRPAEVLVKDGKSRLIRRAESFEDLTQCLLDFS